MSDDCISRQAVLDEMMLIPIAPLMVGDVVVYKKGVLEGTIKALPSVIPKPKTGHWIKSNVPNEEYVCSECGGGCWYYDYQADVTKSKYCPNCGAKMEVSDGTEI